MLDTSELLKAMGQEVPEEDKNIIERLRFDDSLNIPVQLTDADMWANYCNDDLYFMDKKIREFLQKTSYKRSVKGGYKTTASAMFTWIFGRAPTPHDGFVFGMIHMLLKYYCTEYTGKTTFQGKPVNRVYKFSRYACRRKRAYSLRLRLEEAEDKDDPNLWRNSPGYNKDKRAYRGRANKDNGPQEVG